MKLSTFALTSAIFVSRGTAQLSGSVGPSTTREHKVATKVCNVLDYGAKASKTSDVGPAIASAWAACKSGGQVYIPAGDYGMSTWVTLNGGTAVSINLDGIIYRTGTAGGNMIYVRHTTDLELYSSSSKGAVQGYGYTFHSGLSTSNHLSSMSNLSIQAGTYGPRILRLDDVTNFSVHDLALVDSPAFHFTMDTCTNGEVYNMMIRGGNEGGLDGIDIWGTNIHVHDVEVTNKDECVTVKSPAKNILVENVFCNWSGGCAIGSLGTETDISYVKYNNIYTQNANQMMIIKSNGGSGSFSNSEFSNFIGHSNAYTLDIDGNWAKSSAAGSGVLYSNLTFSSWKGTASNGVQRAPMQLLCPSAVPCHDIKISDFNIGTETGKSVLQKCANAYGSGAGCLNDAKSDFNSYNTVTKTMTNVAAYKETNMRGELTEGVGITASIAISTVPITFFPEATPAIARLGK
ncbi:hypothetical protein HYALB_00004921 [Hymenoscyphus albidus]|uniref:Rhamnogalacturonase A n=1 Tax=Hymenoscyphus albidus TaxID=595503 RepID=A0A9N9LG58_9HELO|nr:hypothetical protein HYALB_00004921 [Hymenoscyphus albidus]